ncbi:MAG: T9SS type A sorting domain-containing protein [Chitinophagales bacterium]|nr:T9SS type A sorting domain-containing protein [Chitinophagales bacterium]
MKRLFILLYCSIQFAQAQVISDTLIQDWQKAGYKEFKESVVEVSILDFGGAGDSTIDNTIAFQAALADWDKLGHLTIHLPQGNYLFRSALIIPSNVSMQGVGAGKTKLYFDNNETDAIYIGGKRESTTFDLSESLQKGDTVLTLPNVSTFMEGDLIFVKMDTSGNITSDWAVESLGQMATILHKNGNQLTLDVPMRINMDISLHPRIFRIRPVENVTIENLHIIRLDSTIEHTSNINFIYAQNCLVTCLESSMGNFAHINMDYSKNITIEKSYFHDAFKYDGGGDGYGVALQFGSGHNVVVNNIFRHLRHAILFQASANGNVVAYNYSREPIWDLFPANAAGDIVLHGNYPFSNLIEGNICQNIVVDNSHGMNGPDNTFFRNRAELFGIVMNNGSGTGNRFIGNEVTNTGFGLGNYLLTSGQFAYGNNIKGTVKPNGTSILPDTSYFYFVQPSFLPDFPPIGIPNSLNTFTIPAKKRFDEGRYIDCSAISAVIENEHSRTSFIYPNPGRGVFYLRSPANIDAITVFNAMGRKEFSIVPTGKELFLPLSSGIYFVQLVDEKGMVFVQKLIVE